MKLQALESAVREDLVRAASEWQRFLFTLDEARRLTLCPTDCGERAAEDQAAVDLEKLPEAARESLARPLAWDPFSFIGPTMALPWIEIDEHKKLSSPQASIFGIYALRVAVRSYNIGLLYFAAAEVLGEPTPLAPGVLLYATAAENVLLVSLALWGRVFLEGKRNDFLVPLYPPGVSKLRPRASNLQRDGITARFSEPKGWTLEQERLGHSGTWRLLEEVGIDELPDHLLALLDYGHMEGRGYLDTRSREDVGRALGNLAKKRNDALYAGMGYDTTALMDMENGESWGAGGLDFTRRAFRSFCRDGLAYAGDRLADLLDCVADVVPVQERKRFVESWDTPPLEWIDKAEVSALETCNSAIPVLDSFGRFQRWRS